MKCPNCGKEMRSKVRDYEYIESGLKNVVLKNIAVHECPKCGEVLPEIANVKQVHKWIAEYLLKKQSPLTGEEFRFLRKSMGKSAKELAPILGVHPVTISRWENDQEIIGPQSDRLIRVVFAADPDGELMVKAARELLIQVLKGLRVIISKGKPKPERIVLPPPARTPQKDSHAND